MMFPTFRRIAKKFYATDGTFATLDEGVKLCSAAGGRLALPRSLEENEALVKIMTPLSSLAYIGTTDRRDEGNFTDQDGANLTFTNWSSSQPDDYRGAQDCVIIDRYGTWDDNSCDTARLIICEM